MVHNKLNIINAMVRKLTKMEERMDKGLLLQEIVQTTKKDQHNGLTNNEKLKVEALPFKGSYETLFNDFVTCNYIRGYN